MATKGDGGIRGRLVKLGDVCKLMGMIWLRGEMDAAERRGKKEQAWKDGEEDSQSPRGRVDL